MRYSIVSLTGIIPAYAGSTYLDTISAMKSAGSSPHTRGARSPPDKNSPRQRDHPRIRGEHVTGFIPCVKGDGIIPAYAGSTDVAARMPLDWLGSSPHTRGARALGALHLRRLRDHPRIRGEHGRRAVHIRPHGGIIPAYAGSTASDAISSPVTSGSSPHTRGAHTLTADVKVTAKDHPRIRGEH